MVKILMTLFLLLFLVACSDNYASLKNDYINFNNALEAALYNHKSVIEVELVTLEPYISHPETDERIEANQIIIYRIKYKSEDYEVMAYVAAPSDFMETLYPILILNRGGNNKPGFRTGLLEPQDVELFALRGYIVLASQYRGAFHGMAGTEQMGGDDVNDVLRLIDISESFEFAQQGGVFMAGASRGGMMTYIALRMDDRIKAAASWAGVSNAFDGFVQRRDLQFVYTRSIGGTPEELPEEYERRSAVMWADEITTPLLIGHGGYRDWRVLTEHSINLAEALERYERPHRLIIYPDADHGIPIEFIDEVDEWFRKHTAREQGYD